MVDYVALRTRAAQLVEANGRPVTFVRLEDTPADANEPWRGADTPRSPAAETVSGDVVAVPPSSATTLGISVADEDFVKRSEQILIAAAESDIENFDEVLDGAVRWRITTVEKLRPAGTTLLFFVGVRR